MTNYSLILSSIFCLNSLSFQFTLVSISRILSPSSKESNSIFCCSSMLSLICSLLASSSWICRELCFSSKRVESSDSTEVTLAYNFLIADMRTVRD